ncbi:hypothetical protein P7_234 [Pectobacterium phage vB_PcaM_P7_Pc]|nr:hypothetical protein P7_234 [Pectobacterium phage vB_PcaM_P7_Pc]
MTAYSGIGSRETPQEIISIVEDAAFRLARIGFVLRSGKAAGADAAFQRGAQKYHAAASGRSPSSVAEIYIPWKGFKGGDGLIDLYDITLDTIDRQFPENADMRWDWVKEVHGGWERLSQGARKLHERNIHQLFGHDLGNAYLNQSKFVLYYALETKKGDPKGGTATCVNLAKKQGIRTLNLLHEKNHEVLEKFLVSMEEKRGVKS